MDKVMVSACVMTFNNGEQIEDCLKSVTWADETVVVDSFSTDQTIEICRKYTDRVYQRRWPGFKDQSNYTMSLAQYRWILFIDADERITPELFHEIQSHINDVSSHYRGFYLPRKTFYLGKWINHGDWYPAYDLRLYQKDKGCWVKEPHAKIKLDGKAKYLKNDMLHFSYKNLSAQLSTIDKYTDMSANEMEKRGTSFVTLQLISRPLFRFIKGYLLKRGFMDGVPGFVAAITTSFYVFMKYAKLRELRIKNSET
ncbi:MAG: glycosyltransferase family 2 protein [Candidatus Scalindua sp. AMX11]|nr:MAG: glycosyltransferase family 2 protein [Candidatus Scalindua sp.]RZV95348.1 MAG: glycosyltransferase family 2 protein [Candidatus Scalindua sp. SCAELEC01]TDE66169.1 MAG: glycosyltransferase family 2 protein [Candidatus Scalindua sp. AMX11]GJQ57786.1 MAG: glycosyl transferase [Candidatus Scalindua sp.]